MKKIEQPKKHRVRVIGTTLEGTVVKAGEQVSEVAFDHLGRDNRRFIPNDQLRIIRPIKRVRMN